MEFTGRILENNPQYKIFRKPALVTTVDNIYWIVHKNMTTIDNIRVVNKIDSKFGKDVVSNTRMAYNIPIFRRNIINNYKDKHRIIN